MKILILVLSCLVTTINFSAAQSGNPANFHIEGNLYANNPTAGIDDWFKSTAGTGLQVIDTSGTAGILATLGSNLNYSFMKRMTVPTYSVVNSRIWIDALFARDNNSDGGEQTVVLGNKSKNGANPTTQWQGGSGNVGGGANDIIDMFAHARRDGTSITNNLWVYGAISYGFTGGSHFFDYEFYQSPISFNAGTGTFSNSGNDEGHTAWRFAANGAVISAGDVAVAMGFSGSSLTSLEIRLWVRETDFNTITPNLFSWSGSFDKLANTNQYGYGSITIPAAAFFYSLNTSTTAVPAAPWGTVRSGSHFETTYEQGKFFEFGINFTALGVDNQLITGQNPCASPFRKLMVKSRTSLSFTSDLKDFIGPMDFLNITAASAAAGPDQSICLSVDTALLSVAIPANTYGYFNWTSEYGTGIVSRPDSMAVYVNMPGIYYVDSYVYPGCPTGGKDTILVTALTSGCATVLSENHVQLKTVLQQKAAYIEWKMQLAAPVRSFILEKSLDGLHFTTCYMQEPAMVESQKTYSYNDYQLIDGITYYRLKIISTSGAIFYSSTKKIWMPKQETNSISVKQTYGYQGAVICGREGVYSLEIMNTDGKIVLRQKYVVGQHAVTVQLPELLSNKMYLYRLSNSCGETASGKLVF
jgi:hypothetical protein